MFSATPQYEAALGVLRTLRAAGYEAYLAGGCVRDLLLGREPEDYDVAASAEPRVVLDMFPRTFAVGAHFGVVLVETAGAGDAPPVVTEVATFRTDGDYSDGRHPDEVRYTLSAEEDVRRRDFTINGLLLDPLASPGLVPESLSPLVPTSVLDYVGGAADLAAGVVRAIGQPERRFEEDRLRMLRAVRFAARFGFEIEAGTSAAIRAHASGIASVSRERVRDELTKMLTEGRARRAFELLDETGLLREILPELAAMKGVEQPPAFHPEGDVWTHTLMLLEQLEAGCPATLAWATLLHDVGKPPTFERAPDRIRFNNHPEVGAAMAADLCRRFRFSNEESRLVVDLVANHMRFRDVQRMKLATLKRFLRLESFEQHLALHRMDCLASHGDVSNWEFVRAKLAELPEAEMRPRPLITGRELIAEGFSPGPLFSEILLAVEEAQLEGRIVTPEEAMRLVQERFGGLK
jgi:poly(A) polymerase